MNSIRTFIEVCSYNNNLKIKLITIIIIITTTTTIIILIIKIIIKTLFYLTIDNLM